MFSSGIENRVPGSDKGGSIVYSLVYDLFRARPSRVYYYARGTRERASVRYYLYVEHRRFDELKRAL